MAKRLRTNHSDRAGVSRLALLVLSLAIGVSHDAPGQTSANVPWCGAWAASQQVPEPANALPTEQLRNATLRQVVHLSIGGSQLRVRLSNAFGTQPLHVVGVHVARPLSAAGAAIDPISDRPLTFAGAEDVTIPAGADYVSDAIEYPTKPLSNLSISLLYDAPPQGETSHPGSRATTYLISGNHLKNASLPAATAVEHWFQLSGVDVAGGERQSAIVALGDSITDGHGSTTNGDDRWPDDLAVRLEKSHALGVLNEGIGGNRLLLDGLGPNAMARFDRDVLAQSGVKYLIVLEGVNDLGTATRDAEISESGHNQLVAAILRAYQQMIEGAHAHGILIFGGTITPYGKSAYYHPGPLEEDDRQKINAWIRTPGHFDGVIDFDKVLRDAEHPDQLAGMYDSGDHLHPSPAGYKAMADAVPLSLFENEIH